MALSYVQIVRLKMMNAWYYFYVAYDIKRSLFPSFPIPPGLFPSPSVSLFVLFTDLIDSYEKWLSVRVWAILLERKQLTQTTSTPNALTHTKAREQHTHDAYVFFASTIDMELDGHMHMQQANTQV